MSVFHRGIFAFVYEIAVLIYRLFPGLRREKEARFRAQQKMYAQAALQT